MKVTENKSESSRARTLAKANAVGFYENKFKYTIKAAVLKSKIGNRNS